MQLKLIAAALSFALGLTLGGPVLAAGDPPARPIAKRLVQASSEDLLARTVFQVLIGELALRRGDAKLTQSSLLILSNRLDELAPQLTTLLAQDKANLGTNLMQLNRMLAKHGDKTAVQKLVDRVAMPYETDRKSVV